jgi:2,5-diamino-6-(ribosylamino)-4(3H)-pyrimidinone 5'-phosphate reductase
LRITINTAMTIDGKIATSSGDSAISSKEDLKRLHRLRAAVDAVVVGISTVLVDDPCLTVRYVKGKNPARVIVDSKGRIPLDSKILQTARRITTIVAVTKHASADKKYKIRKTGAVVITVSHKTGNLVDLEELFTILEKRGIKNILVEGGGEINWSVLNTRMVDELIVTISSVIVGGKTAPTFVDGDGFKKISEGIKLKLIKLAKNKKGEVTLYFKPLLSKVIFANK